MVKKKKETGNIRLNSGDLLKFSSHGLKEVLSDCSRCLCCGAKFEPTGDLQETREHIVPEWVIDYCHLARTKSLQPNGQQAQYSKLTIRCCRKCNQIYSSLLEKPLSEAFKGGYTSVMKLMNTISGKNLLFSWVAFISAKKRLHSALHRFNPNPRVDSELFEDEVGIESITWLLTLPVSLKYGNQCLFSRFMMVLPTVGYHNDSPMFDLIVDPMANSAMITIGNTSLLCGFSHGCPPQITSRRLRGIQKDTLFNQLQVRELYSELSAEALSFQPKYYYIKEYDGCLSLAMDESWKRILCLPRRIVTDIFLRSSGELITNYITSGSYWEFVISNLSQGKGSFFPGRGIEPYFDPSLFHDSNKKMTENIYLERLQNLRWPERNSDPLRFRDLHGAYKVAP